MARSKLEKNCEIVGCFISATGALAEPETEIDLNQFWKICQKARVRMATTIKAALRKWEEANGQKAAEAKEIKCNHVIRSRVWIKTSLVY